MGKFGAFEILILLFVVGGIIFLAGFLIGRMSGRNAANRDFMNRKR